MGDRRRRARCGADGRSKANTGALQLVRELAERVGAEFASLRSACSVADASPREHRVAEATYGAHVQFTGGGPSKGGERAALLRRLTAEYGKATAPLVQREV